MRFVEEIDHLSGEMSIGGSVGNEGRKDVRVFVLTILFTAYGYCAACNTNIYSVIGALIGALILLVVFVWR